VGYPQAVATDLNGTLTNGGSLSDDVQEALVELRSRGISPVLVTGRTRVHLERDFPDISSMFDAVVTEKRSGPRHHHCGPSATSEELDR